MNLKISIQVIENDLLDELIAEGLSTCYYLATYKRKQSWEILKVYDSQTLFRDRPPSVPTDNTESINIKRYAQNWRSLANYYDCF